MAKVILIVEDDPKSLILTRDLLRVSGYKTIEATGGEQGIELAKAKKPDLILMDILMPKVDGSIPLAVKLKWIRLPRRYRWSCSLPWTMS